MSESRNSEFTGKAIVVTGAGSGIGRAVAIAFAAQGARLALADIDGKRLAETVEQLGAAETWSAIVDVTQADQVERFVHDTVDRYAGIDCAVNSAGIRGHTARFDALSDEQFDSVMNVNVRGMWLCMKYEMKVMRPAGNGAIVNIASGAGIVAIPNASNYVTSKHAVIGLTKSAAVDAAPFGVRINAVCPGFTRTPMAMDSIADMPGLTLELAAAASPLGRIAEPEEQADAVLYLCSDRASFVIGHAFVADGGLTIQ